MSKRINVNPAHYKVAGRERQGENVVHEVEKRKINRLRRDEKRPSVRERSQMAPAPPPASAPEQPSLKDRRDRRTSPKAGSRPIARKGSGRPKSK